MKVIAVTPAGRRRYLELLAKYILSDSAVAEWHLWDNCRDPADRAYIQSLTHPKIKVVSLPNSQGDNRSINKFYRTMTDPERLLRQAGRRHLLPASRLFRTFCRKSCKQDKCDLVFAVCHQ